MRKLFVPRTKADWDRAVMWCTIYASGVICLIAFLFAIGIISIFTEVSEIELISALILNCGLWVSWIITSIALRKKNLTISPALRGTRTLSK